MKSIALSIACGLALIAPAAAFDVAVEAPGGYAIVVVAAAGGSEATARQVYEHHEAITQQFEDRWYVVNINDHKLADIGQICALAYVGSEQRGHVCSKWNAPEFVPEYPEAVLLKLKLPGFKVAVEAKPGLRMRAFLVNTTKSLEGADLTKMPVSYFNEEPIHQRFADKFYVIDVPYALDDIVQLCVADISRPLEEAVFECVLQETIEYLPGNEPPVVHIAYSMN